ALALTTARYYTPSGRSIQRDYASTALEEYYAPRDRKPCEQGTSDMKLTDVGRKVYGGDGITPDYCVDPEAPGKFVAHLGVRQVFGEGEARKRSLAWDPQVKKALELIPRADLLLRDPQKYVVQRESERKLASTRP